MRVIMAALLGLLLTAGAAQGRADQGRAVLAAERGGTGCQTAACVVRVRVHRAGFSFCNTWPCVTRVRWRREVRAARYWIVAARRLPLSMKQLLARLRGCETRGIAARYGPGADYRWRGHHDGAYQYDKATWAEAGGSGHAYEASPEEQDVRTARFYPSHRGRWECGA